MELAFKDWLIKRGNSSAANNYPRAIHIISEHYSEEIKEPIDIYKIKDQNKISELAHDYSQSGKFSKFGYEQHGRFRAAIGRYSEFFVQKNNSDEIESSDVDSETYEENDQTTFAYERDLQTTLCSQISELFPGYKIYGDSGIGREYSVGGRRVDVLLEKMENGSLLAVELKSGIADYKVFGQISMYIGLLQRQFPEKQISDVIVVGAIDESLKQACEITDKVALKTYRMSIELERA